MNKLRYKPGRGTSQYCKVNTAINRLCLFSMNNNHSCFFYGCLNLSISPHIHVCAVSLLLLRLSEFIALAAEQCLAEGFVSTNGL